VDNTRTILAAQSETFNIERMYAEAGTTRPAGSYCAARRQKTNVARHKIAHAAL